MRFNRFTFIAFSSALLWAVSCSSHEFSEANDLQSNVIGFNSTINKTHARALNSVSDLNKFFVYGTKDAQTNIFTNQEVSLSGDEWAYTYTGSSKPKWVPGSSYAFYAYSNDNGAVNGTVNYSIEDGLTFSGVTTGSADSNGDLVYAPRVTQVGLQTGNSRVPFNFKHILSQINVVFSNATTNAENIPYNVTINSVSINGHQLTGDFDGSAWSISSPNLASSVSLSLGTTGALALNASSTTAPLFVIPQETSDVVLTYNVTVTNANNSQDTTTKTWKATFDANWLLGYRYNYNIPVSLTNDEYIEFTANSLNSWETGTTGQIKIEEVKG
jgi:hypothetical protein